MFAIVHLSQSYKFTFLQYFALLEILKMLNVGLLVNHMFHSHVTTVQFQSGKPRAIVISGSSITAVSSNARANVYSNCVRIAARINLIFTKSSKRMQQYFYKFVNDSLHNFWVNAILKNITTIFERIWQNFHCTSDKWFIAMQFRTCRNTTSNNKTAEY